MIMSTTTYYPLTLIANIVLLFTILTPNNALSDSQATAYVNKNQSFTSEYTSQYSGFGHNYDMQYCQSSYIFTDSILNNSFEYYAINENEQTVCYTNTMKVKYNCIDIDDNGCNITSGVFDSGPETSCYSSSQQIYLSKMSDGKGLMAASTGSILPTNSLYDAAQKCGLTATSDYEKSGIHSNLALTINISGSSAEFMGN